MPNFCPIAQLQKFGEKWAAAVDLQPATSKSDRLLEVVGRALTQEHPMPLRCAAFAEKRRYKVGGGAGIFVSHKVKLIEAKKVNAHAAFVEMRSGAIQSDVFIQPR